MFLKPEPQLVWAAANASCGTALIKGTSPAYLRKERRSLARYGFWSMAHEARDDFLMLLGSSRGVNR